MDQTTVPHHSGKHFTAIDLGPQNGLAAQRYVAPGGFVVPGKVFLREMLHEVNKRIEFVKIAEDL